VSPQFAPPRFFVRGFFLRLGAAVRWLSGQEPHQLVARVLRPTRVTKISFPARFAAPRTFGMKSGDADTSVSYDILPPLVIAAVWVREVGPFGRTTLFRHFPLRACRLPQLCHELRRSTTKKGISSLYYKSLMVNGRRPHAAVATARTTAPMGAAKPLAMPVIPLPGPPPFPAAGNDVRLHMDRRRPILVADGDHR